MQRGNTLAVMAGISYSTIESILAGNIVYIITSIAARIYCRTLATSAIIGIEELVGLRIASNRTVIAEKPSPRLRTITSTGITIEGSMGTERKKREDT